MPKKTDKDNKKKTFIDFQEIGASGTSISAGIIDEDFNSELTGTECIAVWDKMRRTDSQVWATLQAVKLPILAARWFIEMPDDGDEEIKEFLDYQLFEVINFSNFIEEALAHLDFGFYYFEKVFEIDKKTGKIVWKTLAPRSPKAHYAWKTSDNKLGVTQILPTTPEGENKTMTPSIPMKKLILFTHNREGDNYGGVSILRGAYRNYVIKDILYRIQGISAERFGVGVPIITGSGNFSAAEKAKIEEMLKNFTSNERSFIFNPDKNKFEFDIKTISGDSKAGAISESISHHNRQITMNVLAPFLDLGEGSAGSYALSESQASFFLLSLQHIAKYMSEVLDDHIKELIDINFGEQEKYPKLKVTEIGKIDIGSVASALSTLASSGYVKVDDKLRAWVRETYNLPEEEIVEEPEEEEIQEEVLPDEEIPIEEEMLPEEEGLPEEEAASEEEAQKSENIPIKKKEQRFSEVFRSPRPLTFSEKKIEFQNIEEYLDYFEYRTCNEITRIIERQEIGLITELSKIIRDKDINKIKDFSFDSGQALKNFLLAVSKMSFDYGKELAAKEFGENKIKDKPDIMKRIDFEVSDFIKKRKYNMEYIVKEKTKPFVFADGVIAEDGLFEAIKNENKNFSRIAPAYLIHAMLSLGRRKTFEEYADKIKGYLRSEILDDRCCEMCASLDGRVFFPDDPFTKIDLIHENCRGMWVEILEDEEDVMPKPKELPVSILNKFTLINGVPIINKFKNFKPGEKLPILKSSRAWEKIDDGEDIAGITKEQLIGSVKTKKKKV